MARTTALSSPGRVAARVEIFSEKIRVTPAALRESSWAPRAAPYWDSGTAHLLPRLLRLPDGTTRTRGPLFLSERRPVPARRPAATDICPHTGRARLGYDRARVLLEKHTRLDLHQLRHSVTTHLGEAEVPLQLIMGDLRRRNPVYLVTALLPTPRVP